MSTQIAVSLLNNKDFTNAVYLSESNTLTLSLTNQTGSALSLPSGSPADPVKASDTAFTILVILNPLFTNGAKAAQGLAVSCTGWTATFFPDAQYPAWAISPDATYDWTDNGVIAITIAGVTPTVQANLYNINVDLYNTPSSPSALPLSAPVSVQAAPSGNNLAQSVSFTLSDSTVNITRNIAYPVKSGLTLTLTNTTQTALVTQSWGQDNPTFNVSFIYASEAPGYFALTTPTQAQGITGSVGSDTQGWTVAQNTEAAGPTWALQPAASNVSILGTGAEAIATFTFDDIETSFTAGPTAIYIQWVSIPGYADGSIAIPFTKVYQPLSITGQLTTNTPTPVASTVVVPPDGGPQAVYLNWEVVGASMVQISGLGMVAPKGTNVKTAISRTTNFVLTAYDTQQNQLRTSACTVTALAPSSPIGGQLVDARLGQMLPLGVIIPWSGSAGNPPAGYMVCDGTSLAVASYPALYSVIGTTYGTAQSGYFNLPELSNLFVCGTGPAGRTVGQTETVPSHSHGLSQIPTASTSVTSGGSHTHALSNSYGTTCLTTGQYRASIDIGSSSISGQVFESAGSHTHSLPVTLNGLSTQPSTAAAIPTWYSLCYLIRTGV